MTYFIKKTTGESLVEIIDSSIDKTATDLTLIGKNVLGYGEYINENFVKLLENFASTSEPNNPIVGQLWYDVAESRVKVYDGNGFAVASGPIVSTTPPLTPNQGDFWIDSKENQLYFYDGVDRQLAGPIYKDSQGLSGFEVVTIKDSFGNNKTVTLLWSNANLLGIWSHHLEFTPIGISGYSGSIKPGFNVNSKIKNFKIHGVAESAESLVDRSGNIKTVDDLLFNNSSNSASGTFSILNSVPLIMGANQETSILSNLSFFQIRSNISNQDIRITTRSSNSFADALTIKSGSNRVGVFNSNPAAELDVNGNVIISGNLTVNGSTVTINSTEIVVDDKSITLAATLDPSDSSADQGGIILKGTDDKTFLWSIETNAWDSSEHINLSSGKSYKINDTEILTETSLGIQVKTAKGLTDIGTLVNLQVDDIRLDNATISAGSNALTLDGTVISVSNRRITNLQTPFLESDAATKMYVDSLVNAPWQLVNKSTNVKNGNRVLVNTMSSKIVVGLPKDPQLGDTIRFIDYYGSFHINPLIITSYRNNKISSRSGTAAAVGDFSDFSKDGIETSGGSGTGLTVEINITDLGKLTDSNVNINVVNQGVGYQSGDVITVSGSMLGGISPDNDLVFELVQQDNILGVDRDLFVSRKNASFGLVYVNPSQGWVYTETSESATPTSTISDTFTGDITGNVTGHLFGNVTGTKMSSGTSLTLSSSLSNIKLVSGKGGIQLLSFDDSGINEQVNLQVTPGSSASNRSSVALFGNVVIDNSRSTEPLGSSFRLPSYRTVDRDSRTMSSSNCGELIYNIDTDTIQAYTLQGWVNLH